MKQKVIFFSSNKKWYTNYRLLLLQLMKKHEEKTQETKNTLDTKVDDIVKNAGSSVKVLNFMGV
jgi:hypothetical protein